MGIIISVINNKGGVGKTALTCNLGTALARLKKQVLIIDNDPQCNASGNLLSQNSITSHNNTLYELFDPETDDVKAETCIYPSPHQTGLYCLPNVRATSGLDMELVKRYPDSLTILRDKIKDVTETTYDFTIIDTPPNIGIFTTQALCTSHFVIVPIDASSADSLDGLQEALNLIESVKQTDNPNLKFLRLLINRLHGKKTICKVIATEILKRFKPDQRFETTIPENTALQQAVYLRETIYNYDRTSRAARAFTLLAKEFLHILKDN